MNPKFSTMLFKVFRWSELLQRYAPISGLHSYHDALIIRYNSIRPVIFYPIHFKSL